MFSWELYLRSRPSRLAFASKPPQSSNTSTDTPVVIRINSVGIELPVIPVSFDGKNWPTTNQGVSYLSSSGIIGEIGNGVFYGHNWSNLFGPLIRVKPGDNIDIITKDGKTYKYTATFTQIIEPDNTYILNPTADERLTLYTCIGFLDSKRFVVTAFLNN